jgi:predicted permease
MFKLIIVVIFLIGLGFIAKKAYPKGKKAYDWIKANWFPKKGE